MASPAVVGTPSESATTTDGTAHAIARPAGVSGQLTILIFGYDGGTNLNVASMDEETYTQFGRDDAVTTFGALFYYRWEDGSEDTGFSITTDDSEKSATIVYSISGAENPGTQPPEIVNPGPTSASTSIDPPAITPTGGSKDYLFITGAVINGEQADDDGWISDVPDNYGTARMKTSGTGGTAATNMSLVSAERQATVSSEDPNTFTQTQSLGYCGFTIAIHPAAGAAVKPRTSVSIIGF